MTYDQAQNIKIQLKFLNLYNWENGKLIKNYLLYLLLEVTEKCYEVITKNSSN